MPFVIVFKIAICLLLSFSPLVFPISFLAATLVGFGRLSADSELVSMKAVGVGLFRIARPVFVMGLGVGLLSLAVNMEIAPWGERTLTKSLLTAGNSRVVGAIREKTFNNGFYDLLIYADQVDTSTGKMEKVFLFDERDANNPLVVVARDGAIFSVKNDNPLASQNVLALHHGSIHKIPTRDEPYQRADFANYQLYLKLNASDTGVNQKPRMLAAETLLDKLKDPALGRDAYLDFSTEFWKRLATAISPLIFVFLGMGLGTIRTRSSQSAGVLLTFLTALVYWEVLILSVNAAKDGKLLPAIAMQIPNVIIAIAAYFGFRKAAW